MSDHWQTIERALTLNRIAMDGSALWDNAYAVSGLDLDAVDAALAFVQQMREGVPVKEIGRLIILGAPHHQLGQVECDIYETAVETVAKWLVTQPQDAPPPAG